MITTSVNAPLLGWFQPAKLSNRNPIQITDKSDSKFMLSCSIPFSYLTLPCHLVSKAQMRTWWKTAKVYKPSVAPLYHYRYNLQPPQKTFEISTALTAKCLGLTDLSCIHSDKIQVPQRSSIAIIWTSTSISAHCCWSHWPYKIYSTSLSWNPGGLAATKTRLGWVSQGPTQLMQTHLPLQQCFLFLSPVALHLKRNVEKLWHLTAVRTR